MRARDPEEAAALRSLSNTIANVVCGAITSDQLKPILEAKHKVHEAKGELSQLLWKTANEVLQR
jgi:hypothetical protein